MFMFMDYDLYLLCSHFAHAASVMDDSDIYFVDLNHMRNRRGEYGAPSERPRRRCAFLWIHAFMKTHSNATGVRKFSDILR